MERFYKKIFDFEEKYGFHDMYTGGFHPYHAGIQLVQENFNYNVTNNVW